MSGDRERWSLIRRIVADAAGLAPEDRGRFLRHICEGDGDLQEEVESLLRAGEGADEYFDGLARRAGIPFFPDGDTPPPTLTRVGPYRLVRRVGSGGMGTVFLGERADGEFEMRVAVKLLPASARTEALVRRFSAERRILARLSHPAIARILDAGHAPESGPYLVMEYVAGMPIDAYCDEHRLDVDERLELFEEVCGAVAYAHDRAVVHRDLKPGNVLVSADGRPKLLDFGIAKVLDETSDMDLTLSAGGATPVTLAYASPEQIAGEEVGLPSDVYQLGILLQLTLAGRLPFEFTGAASAPESVRYAGGRRVVPPSHAAALPAQPWEGPARKDPDQRASDRRSTVPQLRARLSGELDAIVMKALHLEPARRYPSASALARELQRHRQGRPVAASLEAPHRTGSGSVEPADPAGTAAGKAMPPGHTSPVSSDSSSHVETNRLAVLPFLAPGGEDLAPLGPGLSVALTSALQDGGVFEMVDSTEVLAAHPSTGGLSGDDPEARAVAERLGVGLLVTGEVSETHSGICIRASLQGIDGDPRRVSEVHGAADEVFELGEALAIRILAWGIPGHGARLAREAAEATEALPAYKAFLRGEAALEDGNFFGAAAHFQEALEADADFAPAYFRLALAAVWAHNLGLARRFSAEASARAERLSPDRRSLLSALDLHLAGRISDAEEAYSALLQEAPGDLEAAFLLGALLFHHNPLRGRSQAEARPFLERVLAVQPSHILALLYLSTVVARGADVETLDLLTERIDDLFRDPGPPGYAAVARAQRVFANSDREEGRAEERAEAVAGLREAGTLAALTAAHVVTGPMLDLEGTRAIADLLVADGAGPPGAQATGHILRAHVEWGSGRRRMADHELRTAGEMGAAEAREYRALFALTPFAPAPQNELEALLETVRSWDSAAPDDGPPPIPHFAPHHGVHQAVRSYLLGLTLARLHLWDEALHEAGKLEETADRTDDVAPASFGVAVRAEVALHRQGASEALEVWDGHELRTSMERALSSSFYAHVHARFSRGELLRSAGRPEEAYGWYAAFCEPTAQDCIFLAPAHFRLAEILADRGEAGAAADHYRGFLTLWKDCDPELKPFTVAAHEELELLASPPPGLR